MIENEFDQIINQQKPYHKKLTNKLINEMKESIFYQRPLMSIEELIGPCEMYPDTEKEEQIICLACRNLNSCKQ